MDIQELVKKMLDQTLQPEVRWQWLRALRDSEIGAAEKARLINLLLVDQQREIRLGAAIEAYYIGDTTTSQILCRIIREEQDDEIWRAALSSAGNLIGPLLIPTLVHVLHEKNETRSRVALAVLSGIQSNEAVEILREGLRSDDPLMPLIAAVHLGQRGQSDGKEILLAHLEDEDIQSIAVALALCKLDVSDGWKKLHRLLTNLGSLQSGLRSLLIASLRHQMGLSDRKDHEVLEYAEARVREKLSEAGAF